MIYWIDGYNLMHAVGYLSANTPLNRMESSRKRLLDWLGNHAKSKASDLFHVVFDAKTAPRSSSQNNISGILVSFAFRETADDFLIRELKNSKSIMTVVTNDLLIRDEAKRSGSQSMSCSEFVDWLITPNVEKSSERKEANENDHKPDTIDDAGLLEIFQQPKAKAKRK